ncbi:hypothetical protein [Clostridium sp. YIM B02551]|uniref:TcaA 3rd/4th domain-containing protein n=1 Tax=Clostridium sp. YIM B02551 TaxID=2910679 RepID=UPI001EE9F542|nr:hypothetical protein [Clostridium sp. YIM B02551]
MRKYLINFKNYILHVKDIGIVVFKKYYKVIVPVIVIILISLIYVAQYSRSTEKYFLNSLEKSITNNDVKKFSSLITVNGKKVTSEEVKPLLDYLSREKNGDAFIKNIKDNGKALGITLKNKKKLIFQGYYLESEGFQIKISTNYPSEIDIDSKEVGNTKSDESLIIKDKLPGIYTINAIAGDDYGKAKGSKEISLFKDESVDFELQGNAITIINSPYQEGEVYINNKDINKTVKDIKNYSFFPIDEKNKLYFKYIFPWGEIQSEEIEVGKFPEITPKIQMINDKSEQDITKNVTSFYESVINALNKEDSNLIENVSEDQKFLLYSDLMKKYFLLKNIYRMDKIDCEIEKDSFNFDGKVYSGNVKVKIEYSTGKDFIGISINKEKKEKTFMTTCEYKDNKWIIKSINDI